MLTKWFSKKGEGSDDNKFSLQFSINGSNVNGIDNNLEVCSA